MNNINYSRHFALLLLAARVLSFLFDSIATVISVDRFHLYFGLVGLLHASAWVIALRTVQPLKRRLAFVLITIALSVCAPYAGFLFGTVMDLMKVTNNDVRFFSLYAAASAAGALAYWLAIRIFWLPNLTLSSLARSVALCIVATLLSLIVAGVITGFGSRPNALSGDLPTYFWWVAFSSSFFWTEWRRANKRLQTDRASRLSPLQRGSWGAEPLAGLAYCRAPEGE